MAGSGLPATPPLARNPLLGRRRSRIASAVVRTSARWAAMAAAIACSIAFLPEGVATSLLHALPFLCLPFASATAFVFSRGFEFNRGNHAVGRIIPSAFSLWCVLALVCVAALASVPGMPANALFSAALGVFASGVLIQAGAAIAYDILRRRGLFSETAILVGATDNARRLIAGNARSRELDIVGVFDDRTSRAPSDIEGVPVIGAIDDLLGWDQLPHIDRIIVSVTSDARGRVRGLIERLRILPQRVVLLLDLDGFGSEKQTLAQIARSPAAYVCGAPEDLRRAIVKRCGDIFFALTLLVVFAPVLLGVAIAIRLDSPGPILFRQRRHGFNNRIIRVWKFRSMRDDPRAEYAMTAQATADDPRITRVGQLIRSTSLDELPQLVNVLMGEMSIVGPRPHALGMTAESTEVHAIVADYAHRHRVKPGITGWAQIKGSRGPVHTKAEVRERIRLDLEYVNRSSFWLDLYIMFMTAPCLFGDRQNAR